MICISFKKLDSKAIAPSRQNPSDAGADLRSVVDLIIPPMTRALVKTGLSIELPEGFYGRIAPRSGLALNHGIDVMAGVIDSSYRGEICIILFNTDQNNPFGIRSGDRIAQLIIEKHYNFPFIESDCLNSSDRSNSGFGSSGIS